MQVLQSTEVITAALIKDQEVVTFENTGILGRITYSARITQPENAGLPAILADHPPSLEE